MADIDSDLIKSGSGWRDLNPRPLRPERSALPSCATPRVKPRQRIAPTGRFAKADGVRDNGPGRRCCVDHIRLGLGIYATDRRGITGMSATLNRLIPAGRCKGSERIMTVLGAVVFGGFLVLGVLWLLVTAPGSDVDDARAQSQWPERSNSVRAAAGADVSSSWVLTHSSQK
jgi:hypothetical protein